MKKHTVFWPILQKGMKRLISTFLIISLIGVSSCDETITEVPSAFWKAEIIGHVEGDKVLYEDYGQSSHIYLMRIKPSQSGEFFFSFLFSKTLAVGQYPILPQFGNNPDACVASYCPGPSARMICQTPVKPVSGQIDILNLDSDSLVATFSFETINYSIKQGLIKARLKN